MLMRRPDSIRIKLLVLCVLQFSAVLTVQSQETKVVLFDKAHGELFSPSGSHPLDYSMFASLFTKAGYELKTQTGTITGEVLKRVQVFVMSGAFKELQPAEVSALVDYVQRGGSVILLLHVSIPVARLTEQFGIIVSNATVYETEGESQLEGKPYNFTVSRFHPHPIFSGVRKMAVYGSWGLMCEGNIARGLATTSPKAFADVTQNKQFDPEDPVQAFGIVASAEKGMGKILVIADDAVFSNAFINEADNIRVGGNIVEWLTPASKR
jgi:hypothetical protein